MDLESLKTKSQEFFQNEGEVVSVKQYFAIIGTLMIVIILGINFFVSWQKSGNDKKEATNTLTPTLSPTPQAQVAGAAAGPQGPEVGVNREEVSTPTKATATKAPTVAPVATSTPTNTPVPQSTNTPTPNPSNTPTPIPTEATSTPTPTGTPTPTP